MVMALTCGRTVEVTKVSMSLTRSMDTASTSGLTGASTRETGPLASSMARESMLSQMERCALAYGITVNV